ncbi:uncharacterized protein RJT21DRAFT_121165 [Scheffersomyces amazonensis]|uniref:uncharacterized protein n=1 Tax=Scheffersomyces amazonensis TaxID=1078765 RepID=UPI00315C6234
MSGFEAREEQDGVRLSWNTVPKSKFQHQRNILPLGAMYTPLNNKSEIQLLPQDLILTCFQCFAILNPYSYVSNNNFWTCPFCSFTNQLPPNFQTLPPSLSFENTTVEYLTGKVNSLPPIFFYVVDTCFEDEDITDAFESLKDSLIISLSLLPENALVGFISFGKHIQVHDLISNDLKSFTFNGNKHYTLDQISKSLGLLAQGLTSSSPYNQQSNADKIIGAIGKRFIQPVSIVEYQLTNIIQNLVPNSFPHPKNKQRPERATGSALNIASLLLKSILGDHITTTGGHILCFIGGMTTYGPGKIVNKLLKEPLRSHHDIDKLEHSTLPQAPTSGPSKTKADISLFKPAKKFYHDITKSLVSLGLSCNFFIGSYNQVGLFEMDEVCYKTGGTVVMSDSFNTAIFKQSFIKFFKKQSEDSDFLDMGFNATLEVKCSVDLKIQGLIGNATALPLVRSTDGKYLSTYVIGESGTNCWKLCNVNPQSSYAIYFDKVNSNALETTYIQFLFHYQHPSGEMRLRVTTIPISVVADTDMLSIGRGFDQEAALVIVAREAINKLQPNNFDGTKDIKTTTSQKAQTILKNLDKMLIDFCARFAQYQAGILESFRLSTLYSMFPQFIYHLRRSQFINVFGNSPDETAYIRHVFMHEDVNNSLLMVQPLLLSYDIDTFGSINESTGEINNEPTVALLDSASLGNSKILLLDTFFQILIHHGSTVAEWRKAGYQDQPEYEHFKEFLEAPKKEAMIILMDRFPLPRFIDCDEGGSQARFLMAKLNPSTSYATNANHLLGYGNRFDVLTDDTSLQSYMTHVQKNVISLK